MPKSTHSKKQNTKQTLCFPGLLSYLVCHLPHYLCALCVWTYLDLKLFCDEVRLCIQLANNHSRLQVHRPRFQCVLPANHRFSQQWSPSSVSQGRVYAWQTPVTTTPALLPANILAEDYCKEQSLTQAPLRLCSAGCSSTTCCGAQRQQHELTSSAYNVLLSGNMVGAPLGEPAILLGMQFSQRLGVFQLVLCFNGGGTEGILLLKSLLDKAGVYLGVIKICWPIMSMLDSQIKKDCLTEPHFVSDRLGWAGSKVLLLPTV